MSGITLEVREKSHWSDNVPDTPAVVDFNDPRARDHHGSHRKRGGLFSFISELRRRKVCRAATAYCIALWLTCQIVEVVSPAIGLPEWTLELVIVLGLVGLPIALVLSWLFEVTPAGLVLDHETEGAAIHARSEAPRNRFDQVIDCSLLLVAIVIGAQLALISFGLNVYAKPLLSEELYVSPFTVMSKSNGEAYSGALQVELQHEMARLHAVRVVVPTDPAKLTTGSSLTGSVSVSDEEIQVTAIVVSNQSGELTWSAVLSFSIHDSDGTPRSIAKGIVTALETWSANNLVPGDQDG